jgi:hypothetical protein
MNTWPNAVCIAECGQTVEDDLAEMLKSIANGRLPIGFRVDGDIGSGISASSDGTINPGYTPPWTMYPEPLERFVTGTFRQLFEAIRRVLDVARWRYQIDRHVVNPFTFFTLRWREDSLDWNLLTSPIHGVLSASSQFRTWDNLKDFLTAEIGAGRRAPVAWEVFRDAQAHSNNNPRTAVILAALSAEVGVKAYVAERVPSARYLMEETQIPAIPKLLANYVHTVAVTRTADSTMKPIPSAVRKDIQKLIEKRNQFVHNPTATASVDASIDSEFVEASLEAVRRLLSILDYYNGHDWALGVLPDDMANELKG